jgi:hypothetical protein
MGKAATKTASKLPHPTVEHVMLAFNALASPVPVLKLIGELERRGFDSAASIQAFDKAVFENWLAWTEGVKLVKPSS